MDLLVLLVLVFLVKALVNINGNDYNRVYYSDGSYKTYGTKTGLLYQNTHDSQPTEAEVYDHPI